MIASIASITAMRCVTRDAASLDEPAEAMLYRLLQERLKGATIISIGHRSTLSAFHRRRVEVTLSDGASEVRDVPLVSAAE